MHELAEALRVDSLIIESRLSELARRDRTIFLVLDQVVTKCVIIIATFFDDIKCKEPGRHMENYCITSASVAVFFL